MAHSPRPESSLVWGTSALGASTRAGTPDEDVAVEAALALLREGSLIDTSNAYAAGRSEETLGAALADLAPAERDAASARIITKVDRDPQSGRLDAGRVRRSVDESLTRLGVERVPLLHLHDPYSVTVAEALASGGVVDEMQRCKDEGIAGAIGIAAGPVPLLRRYVDSGRFDAILCHNRFTLVDQSAQPLFIAARDKGMSVFNAAPFGGDLLARGAREDAAYGYRPASAELQRWTTDLVSLCAEFDVALPAAALHFSLRSSLIDHTVVGVSSPDRLESLITLAENPPPHDFWTAFDMLPPAPSPIDDTAYGDTA